MGLIDIVKVLFIPALIAAALYGLCAYLLIPALKRYQNRYSQYLPLDSISQHTNSFRDRVADFVTRLVVPRRMIVVDATGSRRGSVVEEFADADGDRMFGFDVDEARAGHGESGRAGGV